ncbi:helix-turn-helix transcriptional regulator [Burkholderia anthina]|uniref:Helix-turn-helix transcriptional regulator n=2 Tax=Burkholderia anthina TaxID=179879 RepID=A0A6P2G707_9BURK|nr:AraC family transcriptional regulator [Burkholderia anthina]MBM2769230.1 helix-turn-helix transcriptional regulator [Burkholderia anthina]VVU48901.1 transcriptional regulator PchR [Burkholderia anthina]
MQTLKSVDFFDAGASSAATPPGIHVRTVDLQPGLAVSLVAFDTEQDLDTMTEEDGARIHFNCLLGGRTRVAYDGRQLDLDQDDALAVYSPGKHFQLECTSDCRNIELRITRQLLSQLAGEDTERLDLASAHEFALRRNRNTLRIREAAVRLGRLLSEEHASPLLVHSAALEFLAWHLQSMRPDSRDDIAPRERRQLVAARDRLLSDLSNPPTIEQLARETGLNQLKIKRGFKAMFGSSVYALFQRERMEQARHLLQRHSVTETASMLGYSNLSHFSAAFRKQFGLLPRESRRHVLG